MSAQVDPQVLEELAQENPVGRNATPQDVAEAMEYLTNAKFVTGQVLPVNGVYVI
jgi:NAD(P)-dependent dehydrogenase (short-subunit alcohol dehydrogenase family)